MRFMPMPSRSLAALRTALAEGHLTAWLAALPEPARVPIHRHGPTRPPAPRLVLVPDHAHPVVGLDEVIMCDHDLDVPSLSKTAMSAANRAKSCTCGTLVRRIRKSNQIRTNRGRSRGRARPVWPRGSG